MRILIILTMTCNIIDNISRGTLPITWYLKLVEMHNPSLCCSGVLENLISLKRCLQSTYASRSIGKSSIIERNLFHNAILFMGVIQNNGVKIFH